MRPVRSDRRRVCVANATRRRRTGSGGDPGRTLRLASPRRPGPLRRDQPCSGEPCGRSALMRSLAPRARNLRGDSTASAGGQDLSTGNGRETLHVSRAPRPLRPTRNRCRFDESRERHCVPLDPIGTTCPADQNCRFSNRTCESRLNKCAAPGLCVAAETCGNGIDDNCNGITDCQSFRTDADGDRYCGDSVTAEAPGAGQRLASSCAGGEPASCDGNAGHHPGAAAVCGTDTDCDGNAQEGCPPQPLFAWSSAGPIAGRHCVQMVEPSTRTLGRHYLCRPRTANAMVVREDGG